ncbi:polysaccharide deacetylase family protein [Microbacterium sp. SORGH_AS_0888]|uniref:polysaccharide deacetylase family protein n=1 Tax=Microbacterium sp. SORGH_AS_0888 TaxID=3041791 RepID=UPI00277D2B14|nr:polysaccharide deacetylase family protein [Microbacterium sp. SORGH_AS_0888]MDQ1130182.1 hypothetical protein [Microbacterium sp. SORGH_AS_0888]
MEPTRQQQRTRRMTARRRRRLTLTATSAVLLVAAVVGAVLVVRAVAGAGEPVAADPRTSSPAPSPTPTPLSPEEALLASSADPNACAVSFAGDGIAEAPRLQTQGALYQYLPIPHRDGAVFAGWYASPAAAASQSTIDRINGADLVSCEHRRITVYGAWTTPAAVAAADVGVPILMYHQFTTNPAGEDNSLKLNYIYTADFDAQMAHIADNRFYLPTWDELSAFIDGKLSLPRNSVIITDDDADATWLTLGVPIINKHRLLATSFVITKWRHEPTPSPYVLQRSHTDDMHEAGANGKGRMVNYTADQIAADMEASAKILGAKEVMAYPFGHYNDTAKQGLRQAGFEMARTTEHGYVRPGTDKLALPCIRINYGTSLSEFISEIG